MRGGRIRKLFLKGISVLSRHSLSQDPLALTAGFGKTIRVSPRLHRLFSLAKVEYNLYLPSVVFLDLSNIYKNTQKLTERITGMC